MLSTKVIYAVEVLTELTGAKPNRSGKKVVKRSVIEEHCGMDSIVGSTVFNTLLKYEYIDRSTTGYSPMKELSDISLYELIELFHHGIVIGELVNSMYGENNYKKNEVYKPLVIFEKEMNVELVQRFRNVKIADLVKIENHIKIQ